MRAGREFERQSVQRGGLVGVAPDVGVVFGRGDNEDRPRGRLHLLSGAGSRKSGRGDGRGFAELHPFADRLETVLARVSAKAQIDRPALRRRRKTFRVHVAGLRAVQLHQNGVREAGARRGAAQLLHRSRIGAPEPDADDEFLRIGQRPASR